MDRTRRKFAARDGLLVLLLAVAFSGCLAGDADNEMLERSRGLAKSLGMQLKGQLKTGLEDGGAVQAIGICKDVAPQIASEISRQSGAKVTRTSLRYRNPSNAPEPWQADVLKDFERQAAAAADTGPLEHFETEADGRVRYMLAIRTESVCLACHGAAIAPVLKESLDAEYPHDQAVGYNLGDVRGAFSVSWPAGTSSGK